MGLRDAGGIRVSAVPSGGFLLSGLEPRCSEARREAERDQQLFLPAGMAVDAAWAGAQCRAAHCRVLHRHFGWKLEPSPRGTRKQALGLLSATYRAVEVERH